MKEFDETKPIRDLFETFEAQAPEFNSLFEGEILGDARFHQIFRSGLSDHKVESPAFDHLFAGKAPVKIIPKRRMIPLWIVVGTIAACFTFFVMLPKKIQINPEKRSYIEQTKVQPLHDKFENIRVEKPKLSLLSQTSKNPVKTQSEILQENTINHPQSAPGEVETNNETSTRNDSLGTFTKMTPSTLTPLTITNKRSLKDAYAEAKLIRTKTKRENMMLGTNYTSTNRLLSLVNTKSTSNYPLKGIASNYSTGYSNLEGASFSQKTSESSQKNVWLMPENLQNEVSLNDYKAVYSMPFSIGLSVSLPILRHFELITGLNYTHMSGIISGRTADLTFHLKQELHYLAVPLKLSVVFLETGKFGAYAAVGGTIEKGLAGVQNSHVDKTDGNSSNWKNSQKIDGFQTSLTGQLGISYKLNKTFNIYIEPGVSYYSADGQPISCRTDEPFNFNLSLGLRYRIN